MVSSESNAPQPPEGTFSQITTICSIRKMPTDPTFIPPSLLESSLKRRTSTYTWQYQLAYPFKLLWHPRPSGGRENMNCRATKLNSTVEQET